MPTTTEHFNWLHLTDVHFGQSGQAGRFPEIRGKFLDYLEILRERTGPWHAVLFTGDAANWGLEEEFDGFNEHVIKPLWDRLGELDSADAVFLSVPGNHDLVRPKKDDTRPVIDCLLNSFERNRKAFWANPDSEYRKEMRSIFNNYTNWWENVSSRPDAILKGALPGDFACSLNIGDAEIGIVGLNTTFLQLRKAETLDEFRGKLTWDHAQFAALFPQGFDLWKKQHHVCFLMTHQGPDWFATTCLQEWNRSYGDAGHFAAHFHGHMHNPSFRYVSSGGTADRQRLVLGRSLYGLEYLGDNRELLRSHGFCAGQISFEKTDAATLRFWPVKLNENGRFVSDVDYASLIDGFATAGEQVPLIRPMANPQADEPVDRDAVDDVFKSKVLKAHEILSQNNELYKAVAEKFNLDPEPSPAAMQELAVKMSDAFLPTIGGMAAIRRHSGESKIMDAVVAELVYLAIAPEKAVEWQRQNKTGEFLWVGDHIRGTLVELVRSWCNDTTFEPRHDDRDPFIDFADLPPTAEAEIASVQTILIETFPEAKNELDPIAYIRDLLEEQDHFYERIAAVVSDEAAIASESGRIRQLFGPLVVLVRSAGKSINERNSDPRYNRKVQSHIDKYFGDTL